MAMPANVTTVVVLGTFLTPEGTPSTGTVSFTPSSWLLNSGANIAIPNSTVTKALGTAGDFTVTLPITDDSDLSPEGWVYGVSEVVDGVSQSYNIAIPGTVAAGGTVYLADLAPVAPAGPEYYSLASSLAIGTVTTVATGGSATASITGLAPSQVLNLGIPTGATGTVASAGSGSVGTAAVAPQGDPDTGIYFPAANQVAITTGGTQAALFAAGAVSNPTFTGVAQFPDGSASAPSITNTGDSNTGILFPGADSVSISAGGVERFRVNAANAPTALSTAPTGAITQTAGVEQAGVNIAMFRANTAIGAVLEMVKSSNNTVGSNTAVTSGEIVSRIISSGADGTGYVKATEIRSSADAAVSTGDVPGRLGFYTRPTGGANTERMRIDSNGLITGTGTSLGAWTTYTPTWANLTVGDGTVMARYMQIGKLVCVKFGLTFGSTTSISGTPVTITTPVTGTGNTTNSIGNTIFGNLAANDVSAGTVYNGTVVYRSSTTVGFYVMDDTSHVERVAVSGTVPFTWATGDILFGQFIFEAA